MNKISFEIDSKYENVPVACDKAKEFCIENGLSERESINVEICLDEALNNVVKHSYKGKPGNRIIIELERENDRIRIDIIDFGESRREKIRKTLDFDPKDIENLPESGMGLFIIEQLMDNTCYTIDQGKNRFTLYKNIKS